MAGYRRNRINDAVREEIGVILREVKDPRVNSGMVSITAADVAPDLKTAKIRFSVFGGDAKEVKEGLAAATGFIRRELAIRLNLRITPSLTFVPDTSIEYGAHIAKLLKDTGIADKAEEAEEEN